MAFDIPRDRVLAVDAVEVRLDPAPHPFELANEAAIAANWQREKRETPALFDGRVVLLASLAYRDRRLVGRCHGIRYSTFLYWRRLRPVPSAEHTYAHAMLVSADNALVAIRMAATTANAGQVYFAAGSFEAEDFHDGLADVDGNMAREVLEETGLDISALPHGAGYHALSMQGGTVIFRRYHLPFNADEAAERIRAFVAREDDPEIEGPVIIRNGRDLPDGLKPHMKALVDWHFAG